MNWKWHKVGTGFYRTNGQYEVRLVQLVSYHAPLSLGMHPEGSLPVFYIYSFAITS